MLPTDWSAHRANELRSKANPTEQLIKSTLASWSSENNNAPDHPPVHRANRVSG